VLRNFFKKKESILEEPINKVLVEMSTSDPDSEEYSALLGNLERLVRLKDEKSSRVSPDTMAIVAGNLLGILIIVAYEQKHVMVSRAVGFIMKTRNQP
jgi:hypothetical protein